MQLGSKIKAGVRVIGAHLVGVVAWVGGVGWAILPILGCQTAPDPVQPTQQSPVLTPADAQALPALVAIGDIHGDLSALRGALRLAGLIDEQDRWAGGQTVVVQVGDLLSRGDDEPAILAMLRRLRTEAAEAGGALHVLLGNHEAMNVAGDYRYVTPAGWSGWPAPPDSPEVSELLTDLPPQVHARVAAFRPGGIEATWLSTLPVFVVLGDTLFVHAGLHAHHLDAGFSQINQEVSAWMAGDTPIPTRWTMDDESPLWSRVWGQPADGLDCTALGALLARVPARRMVIGHTVQQQGINSACDGAVWRIDTGMSRHYGGPIEVLRIADGAVEAIRGGVRVPAAQ